MHNKFFSCDVTSTQVFSLIFIFNLSPPTLQLPMTMTTRGGSVSATLDPFWFPSSFVVDFVVSFVVADLIKPDILVRRVHILSLMRWLWAWLTALVSNGFEIPVLSRLSWFGEAKGSCSVVGFAVVLSCLVRIRHRWSAMVNWSRVSPVCGLSSAVSVS